jgi:hypothetical protein
MTLSLFASAAALHASSAGADQVSSVLGIPCTTQANGVQACIGDIQHRVKTWDGVPLDVNIWVPPAPQSGPFPLIVYHHGYGGNKDSSGAEPALAQQGYVVMAYSARGFGNSCGSTASRLADPTACAKGWIHLDDARYEARDTQTLAGLLADLKLVKPRRIGVTGVSLGGGISYLLAALNNRTELPDGTFVRWQSPQGKQMKIAAAVPLWGWSDLAYALTPNGNTLDYLIDNPYGQRVGVAKQSYINVLYFLGQLTGFYSPPGADPSADLTTWFARVNDGEPYDDPPIRDILFQIERYHSAYYLQDGLPRGQQKRPAPILAYNSWADDLFPVDELLRYRNAVLARYPNAEFSLLLAAGPGHPRAPLGGTAPGLTDLVHQFFDRRLKGGDGGRLAIRTFTQGCNGAPSLGPFDTKTWSEQHPGEVRLDSTTPRTFTGDGGNPTIGAAVDPIAAAGGNGCITTSAALEPNTATYALPAAQGSGYTLLGSPTVIAHLNVSGPNAQVDARLWDVAPDGNQTFITRGVLRPPSGSNRVVFQLHPNGWQFVAGHVAKLQLLGRDAPYARPSNGTFSVTVSDLELRLPVHESPNSGFVREPAAPLDRDGSPAGRRELAKG